MILDEKFIDEICLEKNDLTPVAIRVALFLYVKKYLDSVTYKKLPKLKIIRYALCIDRSTVHKALTLLENQNIIKRKGLDSKYRFDDEFIFTNKYKEVIADFITTK